MKKKTLEPEYLYGMSGKVKLVKENGYGFIIVNKGEDYGIYTDLYFHISSIAEGEDTLWDNIKVGQNVTIGMAVKNNKGWQASDVRFLRAR